LRRAPQGAASFACAEGGVAAGELASWNDGEAKQSIVSFVERVTRAGGADFVAPAARVAVFDNDGTLWCEKPMPVQADFLFRRLGEMAARDPSLRARQPWKAVVEKDDAWLGDAITKHYRGDDGDLRTMAAGLLKAYGDTTIEEYAAMARTFLSAARHPRLERPYPRCVFTPMVELLRYLTAHQFVVYIVSGGGRDFVRTISQDCYGIPPERVLGSGVVLRLRDAGATVTLVHTPQLELFDDGPMKAAAIWNVIGRRPILAAGNSNGDIPMLRFCAQAGRPSLALLVNHDDDRREYAYDGGAEQALAFARNNGWTVASVKNDWKTVFDNEERPAE
jgi:phosphoglycolate phosphatase-like HAD superfamily hydrolase